MSLDAAILRARGVLDRWVLSGSNVASSRMREREIAPLCTEIIRHAECARSSHASLVAAFAVAVDNTLRHLDCVAPPPLQRALHALYRQRKSIFRDQECGKLLSKHISRGIEGRKNTYGQDPVSDRIVDWTLALRVARWSRIRSGEATRAMYSDILAFVTSPEFCPGTGKREKLVQEMFVALDALVTKIETQYTNMCQEIFSRAMSRRELFSAATQNVISRRHYIMSSEEVDRVFLPEPASLKATIAKSKRRMLQVCLRQECPSVWDHHVMQHEISVVVRYVLQGKMTVGDAQVIYNLMEHLEQAVAVLYRGTRSGVISELYIAVYRYEFMFTPAKLWQKARAFLVSKTPVSVRASISTSLLSPYTGVEVVAEYAEMLASIREQLEKCFIALEQGVGVVPCVGIDGAIGLLARFCMRRDVYPVIDSPGLFDLLHNVLSFRKIDFSKVLDLERVCITFCATYDRRFVLETNEEENRPLLAKIAAWRRTYDPDRYTGVALLDDCAIELDSEEAATWVAKIVKILNSRRKRTKTATYSDEVLVEIAKFVDSVDFSRAIQPLIKRLAVALIALYKQENSLSSAPAQRLLSRMRERACEIGIKGVVIDLLANALV